MAGLVTSFGSGAATNSLEEIRHADTLFIIGSNTSAQHPLAYARVADAVKNKGAKLIVADPRTTPVAQLAHIHLSLRPGSNLALINAMLYVIYTEKLHNTAFIEEHTEGFSDFVASIQQCTPQWAAPITGLEPEAIEEAARLFASGAGSALEDAQGAKAMILYCMGITQQVTGTESCRALANLSLLTGAIGRESAGLLPLRGQNNVQGSCDMGGLPEVLPGYVQAGSDTAQERFGPVWGDFANECGLKLTETLHAIQHKDISALYIIGENPLLSDADTKATEEALRKLNLLIVQDIFLTETAKLAHVVLPAASYLEKEGTFTNTERRVQRIRPALKSQGQARADWRILAAIIQELEQEKGPVYAKSEDIFNEIRKVVPSYAGMTYARLAEHDGLCWPCPHEDHAGTPILHTQGFVRSGGKGLFTVNSYEARGQHVCADYPFILVTGRLAHHYHTGTMTRLSWVLERECPTAFLEMHPDDAASIRARQGWNVRIRSPRGEVDALLQVTDKIAKGTVFLPFHFLESAANILTSHEHLDPFVKIPEFKVSSVAVSVIP